MDRLALVLALLCAGAPALAQRPFPPEIWADRPAPESELFLEGIRAELRGDMAAAMKLHVRAARNGDAKAAYRMAEIYDFGVGGATRDYQEALKWYNAARVMGYGGPQIPLAFRMARDAEIAGKVAEAIPLYEQAYAQGDANAAERLARIYGRGADGVNADHKLSAKWQAMSRFLLEKRYFLDPPKGRGTFLR